MRLSIVIPAFNEERRLPRCLNSVRDAIKACGAHDHTEVIVCDNNSTDRTAEVAREHGAQVVFEPVNQISRARNRGASVASGDWLLFIDADSFLLPDNLRRVLEQSERDDVVGGGCVVWLDNAPLWGRIMTHGWNLISRLANIAAGSFMFCRTTAFREGGGFSTELFAAEELDLTRKLKRWAKEHDQRFVILPPPCHESSGRKFELYTPWETARFMLASIVMPWRVLKSRAWLNYFYDGRR